MERQGGGGWSRVEKSPSTEGAASFEQWLVDSAFEYIDELESQYLDVRLIFMHRKIWFGVSTVSAPKHDSQERWVAEEISKSLTSNLKIK